MKFKEKIINIQMLCPVCSDIDFQYDDENSLISCNSCVSEFTRDELLEANAENIHQHKKALADQAVREVRKNLQKEIKNIFKNSKVFKVK